MITGLNLVDRVKQTLWFC